MNGILPLTYVSTYEELHTVSFRLKTSAAVKTAKCSLIRLVNEANLIQYRCHLSLPQVPITVERKSWRTDAVLRGLPADILDVDLENVTADAYVTYLCDSTMINTLRIPMLIFPNLSQSAYSRYGGPEGLTNWQRIAISRIGIMAQTAYANLNTACCIVPVLAH
ncbi:hypothetical protein SprV_0602237200 [Sparganum proliferum]